jgi:hypothetical protein
MSDEQDAVVNDEAQTACGERADVDSPTLVTQAPPGDEPGDISRTTVLRTDPPVSAPPVVDPEVKARAKAAVEYAFGVGLSEEQADREAVSFAMWRRLTPSQRACDYSSGQQAALTRWEELRRAERASGRSAEMSREQGYTERVVS